MARIKDEAIVIRELDWSETSQVVVLLCREHGKVRGVAKGAKRWSPSSVERFSGGFELLNRGQVVATTRPTALATITEWDLQADHHHLRRDWRAQRLAMYAADAAGALLADEDPHPALFDALRQLLESLVEPGQRQWALLRFQWSLLLETGYRPQLNVDVRTGEALEVQRGLSFDPLAGGLTLSGGQQAWGVRSATVRLLREVADEGAEVQAGPAVDEEAAARANRLLLAYIRHLLDQDLPTMRFLAT